MPLRRQRNFSNRRMIAVYFPGRYRPRATTRYVKGQPSMQHYFEPNR